MTYTRIDVSMPVVSDEEVNQAMQALKEERQKMGVAERLAGGGEIPWIPAKDKAAAYGRPCYSEDTVIGKAVNHYKRSNAYSNEYDVVVLLVEGVGEVAIHCQPTVLAREMRDARPKAGEEVGVKYLGMVKGASGTEYGSYKVVVDRATAEGDFNWADAEPPTSYEIVAHTPVAPVQTTQAPSAPAPVPAAPAHDPGSDIPFGPAIH